MFGALVNDARTQPFVTVDTSDWMREFVPLVREATRNARAGEHSRFDSQACRSRTPAGRRVERSVRVNEPNAVDFSHEVCVEASKRF